MVYSATRVAPQPRIFRGITAMGRVPLETKLEQMRQAEILCAPSLGGESFGIVLTEALAAGLPVVASDIPGYRAVLAEGAVGMLVPPGDALALENTLASALTNPELRRDLSKAGRARAERYSWDRVVDQVLEVVRRCHLPGTACGRGSESPHPGPDAPLRADQGATRRETPGSERPGGRLAAS